MAHQRSTTKRVCVVDLTTGTLMRTSRKVADELVAGGNYRYTTKRKLHSFINKQRKLSRNHAKIKGINFEDKKTPHILSRDPHSDRLFVYLFKRKSPVMYTLKEVNPATGKPFTHIVEEPMYERRVLSYAK